MPKKVAILQSNYIPWKGYFDLINMVDEFILYDDMQFTKRDWRNRNQIKTSTGTIWLTIPVEVKGRFFQIIKETKISDRNWGKKHWKKIQQSYSKATFFRDYKDLFSELYNKIDLLYLSEINEKFILTINDLLGIKTKITQSGNYELTEGKTERLVSVCTQAGADEYVSGPAAKDYIDANQFESANIKLTWMNYDCYKEYSQLYPPFNHYVSILDLIFNEGKNSINFMKSF